MLVSKRVAQRELLRARSEGHQAYKEPTMGVLSRLLAASLAHRSRPTSLWCGAMLAHAARSRQRWRSVRDLLVIVDHDRLIDVRAGGK
jgi:hypothetical protein